MDRNSPKADRVSADAAVFGDAARVVGEALGDRAVLLGVRGRTGKLRFWGDPKDGRRPTSAPVAGFPGVEAALESGCVTPLKDDEAARFGARKAVAVPFEDDGGPPCVCVLLDTGGAGLPEGDLACAGTVARSAVSLLRDRLSDRSRLRELEQTLSGFRALMEATSDAVKIVDLDGRVRAWNAGCEALYGYTAREVIGHVLPHMPPAERSRAVLDFRQIASLGSVEEREIVATRKDGSRVTATATAVPLLDSEGLPAGIMTIVRRIESDSRLDRIQGDFLALVSQELKNPLTAVLGFAQLLARPEIVEDAQKRTRIVRALESRAQQMAAVVDDLLLASRIERGDLRLRLEPTDLATLVTETVSRFEQFQPKHRFLIDVDTRMGPVPVDSRRLEQALTNLLSNAVKYSPSAREVRVSVLPDGESALIAVADKGVGIPPADLERVFDRFYKGATAKGDPGTGLGLYLVRMIAEAHEGNVVVASKPDKGSTFTIRLPRAR
jgi:PAS domain S-box-containing protein